MSYLNLEIMFYRILRTNKKERTITIRCQYDRSKDGHVDYKSYPLSKDDFNYYCNYATQSDIYQFMRTDDYYVLSR